MNPHLVYDLLPSSVWNKDPESVSRKRWNAFADGLNELKAVFEQIGLLRSVDDVDGQILDLIGEVISEPRDGRDDARYRDGLRIAIFRQNSNGSARTLSVIGSLVLGDDFRGVRSMYPIITPLDGTGLFDGTGTFAGIEDLRPEDILYGDGSHFGDGTLCGAGFKQQLQTIEIRYSAAVSSEDASNFQRIMNLAAPSGTNVLFYQES